MTMTNDDPANPGHVDAYLEKLQSSTSSPCNTEKIQQFLGGDSLPTTVVNSNLKSVGQLNDLVVSGESLLGDSLYASSTGRIGINTDEPTSTLTLWDEETNLNIGKNKQHTIEIRSKSDVVIGSSTHDNIVLTQNGDAKIKKKRPDEMPKDSLGVVKLGDKTLHKTPRLKSFKLPDDAGGWLAYLLDKEPADAPKSKASLDSAAKIQSMFAMADSLVRVADSIRLKATSASVKGMSVLQTPPQQPKVAEENVEEGTSLVLKDFNTGAETKYPLVSDFYFNKKGTTLVLKKTKKNGHTCCS